MKDMLQWMRRHWGLVIPIGLLLFLITWISNGGQLQTKYLTTEYKDETNPVMRAELCEKYNTVVGTITNMDIGYNTYDVFLDLGDEFTFLTARCYLTKDQIKVLHIGDTVTIRGHIKYYSGGNSNNYEYLCIGDAIGCPPFAFRAIVMDIEPKVEMEGLRWA